MTRVAPDPGALACLAARLLAVDPRGLGGLHLRARAGPLRDLFLARLIESLGPTARITHAISDTQLFGGVDIAATLAAGRVRQQQGLLSRNVHICLAMAERAGPDLAARLSQFRDASPDRALILLDEGIDDEAAPASLTERLAFSVDLNKVTGFGGGWGSERTSAPIPIAPDDSALCLLTESAARLGISSLRAPLFGWAAARAHAVLAQRDTVRAEDIEIAAMLVFAPRATCLPVDEAEVTAPPDASEPEAGPVDNTGSDELPADLVVDAVRTVLPMGLLDMGRRTAAGKSAKGSGGAGDRRKGNRRGRPVPPRRGKPGSGTRVDLIATLRAAAPWQPLRRQQNPDRTGVLIRTEDIHIRRFQEQSDRLIIFAVDASGSSAVARLAEAKGAVELMLGEAYARRDHVALISFRGEGAEVLLPPTRSLVQTKRQLAALPGGGGTPLAAGLKCSAELAQRSRSQGLSPAIAILTDGRANVPLPGRTGRQAAGEDATAMARYLGGLALPSAVIDIGRRPAPSLLSLSQDLHATYVPLPRADARSLSRAVGAALQD